MAAISGHGAVVHLLLKKVSDVSVQDTNGRRALDDAAYGGHRAVVELLLQNTAISNILVADEDGDTALHLAGYCGIKRWLGCYYSGDN